MARFVCHICGRAFSGIGHLRSHLTRLHASVLAEQVHNNLFQTVVVSPVLTVDFENSTDVAVNANYIYGQVSVLSVHIAEDSEFDNSDADRPTAFDSVCFDVKSFYENFNEVNIPLYSDTQKLLHPFQSLPPAINACVTYAVDSGFTFRKHYPTIKVSRCVTSTWMSALIWIWKMFSVRLVVSTSTAMHIVGTTQLMVAGCELQLPFQVANPTQPVAVDVSEKS